MLIVPGFYQAERFCENGGMKLALKFAQNGAYLN